ncbi:MAG: putative bifunctional diguanylate cyclase/phosphodiesterase [Leptospirales bacterium]
MEMFPQEFEHQFILQAMNDAIIAVDPERKILWTNPAFSKHFGYSPEESLHRSIAFLYAHQNDFEEQGKVRYSLDAVFDTLPYEILYRKKDGRTFWGEARGAVITNADGERIGFTVAIRDITRRKELLHSLYWEKEQWFVTLRSIGDAVITTDANGCVTYLNPIAEVLTGWSSEDAVAIPVDRVFNIINDYTRGPTENPVEKALRQGMIVGLANHTRLLRPDGKEFSIEDSAAPIRDDDGTVRGCVIVFRDVTQKRQLEQKISYQANYDSLTDLPNRNLFRDRLSQTIAISNRSGHSFALLYLDVDHFKNVNDRMGHPFGDRILVELGQRFKSLIREIDTVARLGGDEFAVILGELPDRTSALVLGRRLMDHTALPFYIDDSRVDLTVSIGVALYPDDGNDTTSLIRNADIALYQVKREGRNNIQFFSQEMNRIVQNHLMIENELHGAVDREEFYLLYQPIVNLDSSQATGVEALIRWKSKGIERLPDDFIHIAEETGMIVLIGEWVLRTAIGQARQWRERRVPISRLAVNVSVKQIQTLGFVDLLEGILRENRIDPSLLELEITEGILLFRNHHTFEVIRRLRELGVKISIDDFGTEYSSLNYLRNFPVNTLKIDRSFLTGMLSNPYDQAIVLAIITLAKTLALDIVAEGVEEESQARFLRENGCSHFQGFFFSQAVSPEKVETFLRQTR